MKDNLAITHGYRINFNTPTRILRSLFMVHNESVNIWTHCLPAFFLACLLLSLLLVMEEPFASLHQQRAHIEHNIHAFHQTLANLTQQPQSEADSLRASLLRNYHIMMQNIN